MNDVTLAAVDKSHRIARRLAAETIRRRRNHLTMTMIYMTHTGGTSQILLCITRLRGHRNRDPEKENRAAVKEVRKVENIAIEMNTPLALEEGAKTGRVAEQVLIQGEDHHRYIGVRQKQPSVIEVRVPYGCTMTS